VSDEATSFLYPFIDSEERDATVLLADLAESARSKFAVSRSLCVTTIRDNTSVLRRAGAAMAERFRGGGRLFTFGNGGSATDAAGAAELFSHPPTGIPLPAISLVDDLAVLTAIANDVGFDLIFSRQIIAHGRTGDMAIGFSTSGDSNNVLRAMEEATRRGLLTVGLSGYEGGAMATSNVVSHSLVIRSDSVHRIQEAQDAVVLQLWSIVQEGLQ
jgi:D-sedoheptulose 7-phosphate isomerase